MVDFDLISRQMDAERGTPFFHIPADAPEHVLRFGPKIIVESDDDRFTLQEGGAIFSPCEKYRYVLWRIWDFLEPVWLYGMLNPSRATHEDGDNTVDRQVTRAWRNKAGGMIVVNSGAIRETDRLKAIRDTDPIGPDNLYWIKLAARQAQEHIMAFGPDAAKFGGDKLMRRAFAQYPTMALSQTKDGFPGHPLYIGYDAPLRPYSFDSIL
jgi:hypothetical protein